MPPIFLLAVKVAFLVVLYLFVARAVRAVVLDVFGPRAQRRRPAKAARRMPKELVVTDAGGTRTVPLKDSITMGRAATCDLALADTYVSNVHARIFMKDGAWWLEDLGSTNGTYVNRAKVAVPTPVGPGDQIRLGKATLELRR